MKKILVLLFLCFSFCSVKASTYYSDYSELSDWQSSFVESSDIVNVETKNMYKYYREDLIWNYYKEGENPENYPYVDKSKYIYSDFTDYEEEVPINKPIVESKNVYTYQESLPVRYIKINNVYGGYGSLRFTEISIKDGNENEIDYTYICNMCNELFETHVHNGIVTENWSHIDNGGELLIDLMDYYKYDELNVHIYIYDVADEYKIFNMSFYNSLDSEIIMDVSLVDKFICNALEEPIHYNYTYRNLHVYDIKWGSVKITEDNIVESPSLKILNVKTYYRYKDYKYYYYNNIKRYSDYIDGPTIDYPNRSDEYITLYRYQTRDKIEVFDNIVIKDNDKTLDDYITSTTPYEIESNINYDINGEYQVSYITSFKTIITKAVVDNPINELTQRYKELEKLYNELLNRYHILESEYQISNDNMSNLNNKYNILLDKYNETKKLLDEIEKDYEINIHEYNELFKEYEDVYNNLNELIKTMEENNNSYNKLLDSYNKLKEETNNLRNLNLEGKEKYQELKNRYDELLKSYEEVVEEIDSLENLLNNSNSDYEKLNKNYNTLLGKYSNLEDTYNKLKDDYNVLKKEKIEYENSIKNLNLEKDNMLKEYESLSLKYQDLEKSIEGSNKENIEVYNNMINDLNNYKIRINELNMEIENYKNIIKNKEEEKNKIAKEFENNIINLKLSHQQEINELNNNLDTKETLKTFPLLSIPNNYIIIFPFIVFIIMIIVLILYKSKKKN